MGLLPSERRFQVEKLLGALKEERTRMVIVLTDFNEWLPTGRSLRWLHTRLGKTALIRTFPSAFSDFCARSHLDFTGLGVGRSRRGSYADDPESHRTICH